MDRDNRYIRRVIENGESRVRRPRGRRFDFSPRQALYYNDHPKAILEDFDRSEYGAVLREIERYLVEWERQQTPQQAEWVAEWPLRLWWTHPQSRPGRKTSTAKKRASKEHSQGSPRS